MEILAARFDPSIDYKSIINSGKPYSDKLFPAGPKSLVHPSQEKEHGELKQYTWKRASEIFKGTPYEIFDGISVNDIEQGALGDCYFLCAVAAVAEVPNRIINLFETQSVNKSGIYAINGYIMGEKQLIVMDDFLPWSDQYNCMPFVRSAEKEIWVSLLEKAWAKANGSYSNIVSGMGMEGMKFLTGAPSDNIVHSEMQNNLDKIWKKYKSADDKSFIMTASGNGPIPVDTYKSFGLQKSHAYSLIGCREVNYKGQNVRLVQLRNPWGKDEWKGDWSDSWKGWTPELKKQVELVEKNDGTFYMKLEDFVKFFESVSICKWHENYKHNIIKIKDTNKACYSFKVKKNLEGYFELCTQHIRLLRTEIQNFEAIIAAVIIGKVEPDGIKYVACCGSADNSSNTSIKLFPGDYVMFTIAYYPCPKVKNYNIHTYCSEDLLFKEQEWCEEAFAEVCKDFGRAKKTEWADQVGKLVFFGKSTYEEGFGFMYVKNDTKDIKYNLTMTMTYEGMKMFYPNNDGKPLEYTLLPGDDTIVVAQIQNVTQIRYSSSFSYSYGSTKEFGGPKIHEITQAFIYKIMDDHEETQPATPPTVAPPKPKAEQAPKKVEKSDKKKKKKEKNQPKNLHDEEVLPAGKQKYDIPEGDLPEEPEKIESDILKPSPKKEPVPPAKNPYDEKTIGGKHAYEVPKGEMPEEPEKIESDIPKLSPKKEPAPPAVNPHDEKVIGGKQAYEMPEAPEPDEPEHVEPEQPKPEPAPAPAPAPSAKIVPIKEEPAKPSIAPVPENKPEPTPEEKPMPAAVVSTIDIVPTFPPTHACKKNHGLNFSSMVYEGGKYGCDICKAEGECIKGRWNCAICKYDICNKCREPPTREDMPTSIMTPYCYAGHQARYIFDEYPTGKYQCNLCNEVGECSKGRWNCPSCYFDICSLCCPSPPIQCSQKHQLQYSKTLIGHITFTCAYCKKLLNCAEGLLNCSPCKLTVCVNCIPALIRTNGIIPSTAEKLCSDGSIFCSGLHPMFFSYSVTGIEDFDCKMCNKKGKRSDGRWLCFNCDYNICKGCYKEPKIISDETCKHGLCKNNHEILFTTESGNSQSYTCVECSNLKTCIGGCYKCKVCNEMKCPNCIPISYIPGKTKLCTQGHPLLKTEVNPVLEKEYYRCYGCGKSYSKSKSRHRCIICDFDMCPKCLP